MTVDKGYLYPRLAGNKGSLRKRLPENGISQAAYSQMERPKAR